MLFLIRTLPAGHAFFKGGRVNLVGLAFGDGGIGSGHGKTASRGAKGQYASAGAKMFHPLYEGGQRISKQDARAENRRVA